MPKKQAWLHLESNDTDHSPSPPPDPGGSGWQKCLLVTPQMIYGQAHPRAYQTRAFHAKSTSNYRLHKRLHDVYNPFFVSEDRSHAQ